MSGGPLDVSLRVRMRYEAGDAARRAIGDVETIAAKAQRLGTVTAGDKLAQGLTGITAQAQAGSRELGRVEQAAMRLGGGAATSRLAAGLKDAGQAAGGAAREVEGLGRVAARFGSLSTVSVLARDLRAAHAPAQALGADLAGVGKAAEGIGRSRSLVALEGDLQAASRRADELERRLGTIGRRTGGHGGGGTRTEFAAEALRASGLGAAGLRLGMSGAGAAGLAVGSGVAATAAATAMATRQAIGFQHAMTEVGKAIGSTPDGMRDLESQFLSLSRKSGIGKSEIAGIGAQGGYFNVPREQLPAFTDITTKAAVGFQMRPDEAGEAFGPLMKSYKLRDTDELRLAGDAINTVGDSVGVRERNVLNYLNRTSGVAGMLRIPLAQNAAVGGAIQSLGVAPDVAATSFEQVARRLANANLHRDPEFSRGLRGINMSGRQVKGMMDKGGLDGVLTVLEKIRDLKPEKRSNVIEELFGEGEVANVSRMVESLDTIRSALEKVSDPAKYRGSLEKTFRIFNSDTTAAINRAGAALDSFAVRLGQRFDPAVKASADVVTRWLGGMAKAMELSDRAKVLSDKQLKGEALDPKERAELDANPRLKAETDRRVERAHDDVERRTIVEQDGRDRARELGEHLIDRPAKAPAARGLDEQDAAAAAAHERTKARLQEEIRTLDAEIETRRRSGFETTADRLRLRKLRQQYDRQFSEPRAGPAAPASHLSVGRGHSDAQPAASTDRPAPDAALPQPSAPNPRGSAPLPGTGRRSELRDDARASLAAYHEEVDQGLTRTERLVREFGRRMREDLEIRPKVQDAAFRFGGEGGARIERASLGQGGLDGGLPGAGGRGGGVRRMPGRFGGAIPEPRGAGRSGGGVPMPGGRHPTEGGTAGNRAASGLPDPGANPGAYKAVLDHIAQSEGTAGQPGGGYDTSLAYGKFLPGGEQNLTGKSLDEIDALQGQMLKHPANRFNSSALGRYQIVRTTLRGLRQKLGLRGDEKFDAKMQDRLGAELARARGADPRGLHQEWQSLGGERGQRAAELMARIPPDASTSPSGTRPDPAMAEGAGPGRGQPGANGQFDPLGGAARRYSSGFGMRDHPVHGGRRMHYGQDMAAPAGSPVNAMQGGRVSAISRMGDVTVTHPDGSTKTYRHIDPSGIKVGQEIEGGAPIGSLRARDPRSTGPHLHLEATDAQGRKYDPRAEIDEAGRPDRRVARAPEREAERRAERGDEGPRQIKPWARRDEAAEPRSPRFMDPSNYRLKPGAGGGDPAAGGPGAGRFGLGGPSVVQHFHTGADAHEVGRRAKLEENREIRRTMAGALHDGMRPA